MQLRFLQGSIVCLLLGATLPALGAPSEDLALPPARYHRLTSRACLAAAGRC
jgi:hypothetical protein